MRIESSKAGSIQAERWTAYIGARACSPSARNNRCTFTFTPNHRG